MTDKAPVMKIVNPDNPPAPLTDGARAEIRALAARQRAANGLLMKAVSFVGSQVEDGLKMLPKGARTRLESGARAALQHSYDAAGRTRGGGIGGMIRTDRAHKVLASVSGALGGLGGLPTAIAELPIATTVIFRAVQHVAESYGEDAGSPETRIECLRVFGSGGPGTDDDGIDTSFIGARLSLSGVAVNKLIRTIAPRFAALLTQKLASQAVPILGAAAGAGTNYAFMQYYVEIAHVHFGLRQIARRHGDDAVLEVFHKALADGNIPVKRA